MTTRKLNQIIRKLGEMIVAGQEIGFRMTEVDGENLWAVGTQDDYFGPMTTDQAQRCFETLGMSN